MNLRAQVVTPQLAGGLLDLDGCPPALECDERSARRNELGGHAHELAHVGHRAGGHHVGLTLAAQLFGPRLMNRDIVESQVVNHIHEPFDPARHRLGQVHVEIGSTGGDHDARQSRTGTNVEHLSAALAGHKLQDGGRVDDVPRPDAFHVPRAEQAANLPLFLEHPRILCDVGEGGAKERANLVGRFLWDEGVAHLATPPHPARLLTHRQNPRGG